MTVSRSSVTVIFATSSNNATIRGDTCPVSAYPGSTLSSETKSARASGILPRPNCNRARIWYADGSSLVTSGVGRASIAPIAESSALTVFS